ncbi:MAG: hypothetical protein OEU93_01665 [Rubrivivax sp.]|nr:hypothetical protein [Rubrivivax sp.]MDH5338146.1 hypothetical protein [Rubrivivax sp.]
MSWLRTLVPLALAIAASAAGASTWAEDAGLERNGLTSRHAWKPDFARFRVAGLSMRPGLALGLRGNVKTQLGLAVVPALSVDLGQGGSMSLLHAGSRGAMLLFQIRR